MHVRVLGPVEASVDGRAVALAGPKQRAVLAMLALEANRLVTTDHLIAGLWGERAPASAAKMVQNYVWRLRTALGDDAGGRIVTRTHGYELRIEPDRVDVCRFQRLLADARRAADRREVADVAREALGLWRGAALADLADEPFAAPEIRHLDELRAQAAELAIDADLAAGRHQDAAAELDDLVREHPLRERFHAQRMLALYRCGRQADALAAYRAARRTLVDEVGLEPGGELRRLHEAILRQDPELDLEPVPAELPPELDPAGAPPLVGRERELAWLRARWARARAGAGALVAVVGEEGTGKTRLVAALAAELHGSGTSVVAAGGNGAEGVARAWRRARATKGPALLVLDGVEPSAAVVAGLTELADQLARRPVLAIVTARAAGGLAGVAHDSLALEPLAADAVRAIALLYAPGRVEPPVEQLLRDSGGVARAVHEVASAWAREAATRRVVAFAPRAAAGRGELRSAEAGLAEGVVSLQAIRERADRIRARDGPPVCPFKGLAPFEVSDARYFFGRERLVAELVARAVGAPLLAVVGPSGSGKSSAVKAGLLPALAAGALPGAEAWRQVIIRPGEHPQRELRDAGLDGGPGPPVVLAVDQFEEVFTSCRDERERRAFIDAIVRAAHDRRTDAGLLVLAIRADFYGRCAGYPALSRLVGANQVLVGPMEREELRRAIEQPAQRAGLHVQPELVDALLADVEEEPGGLPLLSTALLELWRRRSGRWLRHATYERTGGVSGAVARLAEEAFAELGAAQQRVARSVLLRLAGEGAGGAIVRRRVPLEELELGSTEEVALVLDVLTRRRLLTVSATSVEVAHEALLREWPRLRGWLEEDADGRRVHRHLADAARDWDERGRDPADVYRGARLAVALEWRDGHEAELNPVERAFLDAGRAAGERAHRRLRAALAGAVALLALAVAGGLVALHQRGTARAAALAAEAQRIGAEALTEPDLDRALLLARQAVALDDSLPTRGDLLSALLRAPAAIDVIRATGGPLGAVDVRSDGRTLAVADANGRVLFLDATTRRPLGPPYDAGHTVSAVRFSPDGTRIVVAGYDASDLGFLDLLDGRTHRRVRHLATPDESTITSSGLLQVGSPAFSPDSRVLGADYLADPHAGTGYRRYLVRWDARTGRRLAPPRPITAGPDRAPALVGFLARGSRLLTSSARAGISVIRDAATLRPLRRFPAAGAPAAVSPDGHLAALAQRDGLVRLLDLHTGEARVAAPPGRGPIVDLRFAPTSRRLVAARRAGAPSILDLRRATGAQTLGGLDNVRALAVGSDGRTVYGAGADGIVVGWDLDGGRALARPLHIPGASTGPLAATASTVTAPGRAGYVDVLYSRTRGLARRIRVPGVTAATARSLVATLAPDGRTMAIGTRDGAIRFIDLQTGRAGPPRTAHVSGVLALAFSADGRRLASAGADRAIYVWDVRRQRPVSLYAGPGRYAGVGPPRGLSVSPDGTRLATTVVRGDGSGELEILSLPRLAVLKRVPVPPGRQTQFSADGRRLFYGDEAGRIWTYDTRSWRPVGLPMAGHARAGSFALSPDDRLLATTSGDGTTQLWDVPSRGPIGTALPEGARGGVTAAFVDGGSGLVTLAASGAGHVWDLRLQSWARRACEVAGRPLTRAEWRAALPDRPYAPACSPG